MTGALGLRPGRASSVPQHRTPNTPPSSEDSHERTRNDTKPNPNPENQNRVHHGGTESTEAARRKPKQRNSGWHPQTGLRVAGRAFADLGRVSYPRSSPSSLLALFGPLGVLCVRSESCVSPTENRPNHGWHGWARMGRADSHERTRNDTKPDANPENRLDHGFHGWTRIGQEPRPQIPTD